MPTISRQKVAQAKGSNHWDLSNEILYAMCRTHPHHVEVQAILAKILLIGRVYAAAIERRKLKDDAQNDDFYIKTVAPSLRRSDIDRWISEARCVHPGEPKAEETIVRVHGLTTRLFGDISGMDKRSLASKYLHFHVPELFFIYDSRAARAISSLSALLPRASRTSGLGDNEYRKFAEKCTHLQAHCERCFGERLSPRQIDNLLLAASSK